MTDTTAPALTGGGLTRRVGFVTDIATIARRAVRTACCGNPEFVGPALIIPVFFFVSERRCA